VNASILLPATLIIVGLVVLVLVIYLILIIIALRRAGTHLENLAGGLQKIVDDSEPLAGKLIICTQSLQRSQRFMYI